MKTFTRLLTLVALLATSRASAQWKHFTPDFGDTIGIWDVKVLNDSTVWSVGVRVGVNDTFYTFGVPSEAWFARSTDGGATFKVGKIPFTGAPFVASLTVTDPNTAFVIGLSDFGNAQTFLTTDAGTTWKALNVGWDAAASWPDYIHAFNSGILCQIGDPRNGEFEIFQSVNGGQFWQQVPGTSIPDPVMGEFGFNHCGDAVGNTIWFGTSSGRVYRSKNKGLTWEAFQTTVPTFGVLSFSDQSNGLATGGDLKSTLLSRTHDGGETWEDITSLLPMGGQFRLTGIECIPNSSYVIINFSVGSLLNSVNFSTWVSPDRGATWKQVGTGDNVGWPEFISPTVGYGGEFMQLEHKTRLFKYTGDPLVGLFSPERLDVEITLSPNPATDRLRFDWPESMAGRAALVLVNDAAGRLLFSEKTTADGSVDIDVSGFPAGPLTLTVSTAEGSAAFPFLKH